MMYQDAQCGTELLTSKKEHNGSAYPQPTFESILFSAASGQTQHSDQVICRRIDAQNPSIERNSIMSTTSAMNPTKLPKIMAAVRPDGLLDGRSSLKL
jgi:hypothetical protein